MVTHAKPATWNPAGYAWVAIRKAYSPDVLKAITGPYDSCRVRAAVRRSASLLYTFLPTEQAPKDSEVRAKLLEIAKSLEGLKSALDGVDDRTLRLIACDCLRSVQNRDMPPLPRHLTKDALGATSDAFTALGDRLDELRGPVEQALSRVPPHPEKRGAKKKTSLVKSVAVLVAAFDDEDRRGNFKMKQRIWDAEGSLGLMADFASRAYEPLGDLIDAPCVPVADRTVSDDIVKRARKLVAQRTAESIRGKAPELSP